MRVWTLWAFPLLLILFVLGSAGALAWFLRRRNGRRPGLPVLIAIPLGCLALPLVILTIIAAVGKVMQSGDAELYAELFGAQPTLTEDRMLFDDFGSGAERQIYLRAAPRDAERTAMLAPLQSAASEFTRDQFIARGASMSFSWWISADPRSACKAARIVDAHGYRGWTEFRVAGCLDAGTEFPASVNKGRIWVIARGRAD